MKRNVIAVLFILVSMMVTSCNKMELFTNGEPITVQRNLDRPFSAIKMYNNVNVRLKHDSTPRLELTCPKNLIEKVTTEIEGDALVIKNENEHNWLRSFDYSIDLTVYYDSLKQIDFASIGDLRCIDSDSIRGIHELAIDSTDTGIDSMWVQTFYLNILEGCGDIDLTFSCNVVKNHFNNGTSLVTLRGDAQYTEIIMRSYGTVHAENLNSNFVRVQSHSTNDAYVWARTKLTVWLYSIGNVYYKGDPWIVKECTNDGQVFKLE